MSEKNVDKSLKNKISSLNWLGIITGILMVLLPFLGFWWKATVGEEVIRIALSPFQYEFMVIGQPLTSALVGYFLLAAQISVILGGIFITLGAVGAERWWGKKLIDWGAMRVFWLIISLIVLLLLGALLMNNYMGSLLSGTIERSAVQLELPYLIGSGHAMIQAEEAVTISGPINASFTPSFWIAVITAGLGIGSSVYQNRVINSESTGQKTVENDEK